MAGFNGCTDGGNVKKTDIVDNLTSSATNQPLSAAMGSLLNSKKVENNERGHATVYNDRINSETLHWQRFNDCIVFVWVVAKTSFIITNAGVLATGFPVPSSSAHVDLHVTAGPKVKIDKSGQLVLSEDVAQNIWISAWGIYETGNPYF